MKKQTVICFECKNKFEEKSAVDKVLEPMRKNKKRDKKGKRRVLEYSKTNSFRDIFTVIGVMATFLLFASFFAKKIWILNLEYYRFLSCL